MKRLLLSFLVIALVFCLGGYAGVSWYNQVVTSDVSPSLTSRMDAPPPGMHFLHDSAFEPASGFANERVETTDLHFAADSAPQAIQVSDRFAEPAYQDESHQRQFTPNRSTRQPVSDVQAPREEFRREPDLFTEPSLPSFGGNPMRSVSDAEALDDRKTVDLTAGMSYLIRIRRKDGSRSPVVQMERMYGGERTLVTDLTEQHAVSELRIFAESVEVASKENEFQLKCEGKVAVVANQSMLWGEGLRLEDGTFKIADAEVVTPDAVIKSGDSEFDFAVGGISVERIARVEANDGELKESVERLNKSNEALPELFSEPTPSL